MRKTPLYDEHLSANAKMTEFSGWAMPIQYAGILAEHSHTRSAVSVFDCSHMGEFRLRGAAAAAQFNTLIASDIESLRVGRGRYGALLTENATIIDDVITFRLAEDEWMVVTNAGPLDRVGEVILDQTPDAEDISGETAKIDVQGPGAREAMIQVGFDLAEKLPYFAAQGTTWQGSSVIVARAGYTGELGFELYIPIALAEPLWQAFCALDTVAPAGLGARDTLRLEMGYPLSGQDFDGSRTPLEAGQNRFIAWDTSFRGRDALVAKRESNDYDLLVGIQTGSRRAPRHDFEVYYDDTPVGHVTSGAYGPSVGHGIGLAYVPKALSEAGTQLTVGPRRLEVEVVSLPFYSHGTCRT